MTDVKSHAVKVKRPKPKRMAHAQWNIQVGQHYDLNLKHIIPALLII